MSKYLEEYEELVRLTESCMNESIFSGNLDDGKKSKDKKFEKDDSDDDEVEEEDEDVESEEDDEESETDHDEEEETEEDEENESSEEQEKEDEEGTEEHKFGSKGSSGSGRVKSKLKSLKDEYNTMIVDLFIKYAPECIDIAIEETDSSFGEDLEAILDTAINQLKEKIMGEFGMEPSQMGMQTDIFGGEEGEESELGNLDDDGEEGDEDSEEYEEGEEEDDDKIAPSAMGSFDPDAAKDVPMDIEISAM